MEEKGPIAVESELRHGVDSGLRHQAYKPVSSNTADKSLPAKEVMPSSLFTGKRTNEGNHHLKYHHHLTFPCSQIEARRDKEMQENQVLQERGSLASCRKELKCDPGDKEKVVYCIKIYSIGRAKVAFQQETTKFSSMAVLFTW